jgi:hypothetical protein
LPLVRPARWWSPLGNSRRWQFVCDETGAVDHSREQGSQVWVDGKGVLNHPEKFQKLVGHSGCPATGPDFFEAGGVTANRFLHPVAEPEFHYLEAGDREIPDILVDGSETPVADSYLSFNWSVAEFFRVPRRSIGDWGEASRCSLRNIAAHGTCWYHSFAVCVQPDQPPADGDDSLK